MIPFNKPYLTAKGMDSIYQAVHLGKISGNGTYTKKCLEYFEQRYGFRKTLLTSSCTDTLEKCALLANIKFGAEGIVPSYTLVITSLAFVRQGQGLVL